MISENLAQGGNILTVSASTYLMRMSVFHWMICSHISLVSSQVFFSMLIGAFSLGQAGPNLEAFTSALGAAGTVISTIKRVSISTTLCVIYPPRLSLILSLFLTSILSPLDTSY